MAKKNTKNKEVTAEAVDSTNNETTIAKTEDETVSTVNEDSADKNKIVEQTQQQPPQQINLESSKNTLAVRPWKFGAVKIMAKNDDGTGREVWVAAVIDANGKAVCCGDTVDMEFIIKLENSYDAILRAINASGKTLADAVDVLQDFECKKSKTFSFN